jgi:hypothetical protein
VNEQDLLVEQFVSCFEKLDEMTASKELDPIAWEFVVGKADELDRKKWRAVQVNTDRSYLDPLYAKLPSRFPHYSNV